MWPQLKPVSMKGCVEAGRRLHKLEAIVAAEDLAASGKEKFGGGASASPPPASTLRAKVKSSNVADSDLQPQASPITQARNRRHHAAKVQTANAVEEAAAMSQISDFEQRLAQYA